MVLIRTSTETWSAEYTVQRIVGRAAATAPMSKTVAAL